jgi:hypothetical protein
MCQTILLNFFKHLFLDLYVSRRVIYIYIYIVVLKADNTYRQSICFISAATKIG